MLTPKRRSAARHRARHGQPVRPPVTTVGLFCPAAELGSRALRTSQAREAGCAVGSREQEAPSTTTARRRRPDLTENWDPALLIWIQLQNPCGYGFARVCGCVCAQQCQTVTRARCCPPPKHCMSVQAVVGGLVLASVVASAVFDVEGNAASRDLWWVVNARVFTTGSLPISRRLHTNTPSRRCPVQGTRLPDCDSDPGSR